MLVTIFLPKKNEVQNDHIVYNMLVWYHFVSEKKPDSKLYSNCINLFRKVFENMTD